MRDKINDRSHVIGDISGMMKQMSERMKTRTNKVR